MSSLQVVTAPAKEWLAALSRLAPMTVGKKAVPVLTMVMVDPASLSLRAAGNHGEAFTVLLDSEGDGAPFLVSHSWLRSAITATTGRDRAAMVEVALDGAQVTVRGSGYKLRAETMPVKDFPAQRTDHQFDSRIQVDALLLREALVRALTASYIDGNIPVLDSVHFKSSPDGLVLLSTDRFRLTSGRVRGNGSGEVAFTVQSTFLKHLVKQLKTGSAFVKLTKDGNIFFQILNATYAVAGIAADYPKLVHLFEGETETVMDVNRAQLLEAARVAHEMSQRNAALYLTLNTDGVLMKFNDGLFGPDSAPLAAGTLTGEPVQVAFNPHYFLEMMRTFKGETVRIYGGDPRNKYHFIDGGADTTDATMYHHIIMPVRMPRG